MNFKRDLIENLKPLMKTYGFSYIDKERGFIKYTAEGFWKYGFSAYYGGRSWNIGLGLFIRKNVLAEILYGLTHGRFIKDKKYQKEAFTIGGGIDGRLKLKKVEDVAYATQVFEQLFLHKAMPFFKAHDTLEQLHQFINKPILKLSTPRPEQIDIPNTYREHGFIGLALAKLVQEPKYEALQNAYGNYYSHYNDGAYHTIFTYYCKYWAEETFSHWLTDYYRQKVRNFDEALFFQRVAPLAADAAI